MSRQPALFVSHGAPTIVIDPIPAHDFLKAAAPAPRPSAILVASAHFEAPGPTLTTHPAPSTIHDFGGFPPEMYAMRYPAPGDPALAAHAAELLGAAGFAPRLDAARGFDHGTWTPLMLMYPGADIPVVQVSVDSRRDGAWHFAVGEALAPLRDENVLILGSGSMTHNLRAFFTKPLPEAAPPEPWVSAFADWVHDALEDGRTEDLLDWTNRAPHALANHPTPEHFLPLFVALGAGGRDASAKRIHASYSHGVLAMDAYATA
jgi:4,5-DOPA dioxygenase extradiol